MKPLSWSCLVVGLLALSPQSSRADFSFEISFSGGGVQGVGILNATSNGDGSFTAVSGSAFVIGAPRSGALTLLANPFSPSFVISPSGFFFFDNQLFPGANPTLSEGGLLFLFADGTEVNIWGTGPSTYTYADSTGFQYDFLSFRLTLVPEPSSLTMVAVALVPGLGVWWSRRRSKAIA